MGWAEGWRLGGGGVGGGDLYCGYDIYDTLEIKVPREGDSTVSGGNSFQSLTVRNGGGGGGVGGGRDGGGECVDVLFL